MDTLSETICTERLLAGVVGRVGFVHDGQVHVLPVNYAADATGEVMYRTQEGTGLATVGGQQVVFEIDGFDAASHTGWSVCVRGTAREVLVPTAPALRSLVERAVVSWAPGPRDRWIAISPDVVTGRQLPLTDLARQGWIEGVVS